MIFFVIKLNQKERWWIYVVLFSLLFAAQASAGASWLLVVTATYILTAGFIAVLSLKYGFGSFHKRDTISILIAALGLLVWLITSKPLTAIVIVIIVDIAGFWLTLVKTWHAPYSETLIFWQVTFIAAILSVFAAGTWNFTIIIYPIYTVLATALISWQIAFRRKSVKEDLLDF